MRVGHLPPAVKVSSLRGPCEWWRLDGASLLRGAQRVNPTGFQDRPNSLDLRIALLRILVVLLKVSGFSLASTRISDGPGKLALLRAIERSRCVLPLRIVLRILLLSHSRYHSWKREEECGLTDMPSCPRSSPQQLTRVELNTIEEMATSEEYRHVPTSTLALLAQRFGKTRFRHLPRREARSDTSRSRVEDCHRAHVLWSEEFS